jgi:hypothetical protein
MPQKLPINKPIIKLNDDNIRLFMIGMLVAKYVERKYLLLEGGEYYDIIY